MCVAEVVVGVSEEDVGCGVLGHECCGGYEEYEGVVGDGEVEGFVVLSEVDGE